MLDRREQRGVTVDGLQVQRLTARAGAAIALIETPLQIQDDVSPVRMWFGSGSSANSPGHRHLPGRPRELEGQVLPGDAADEPGGNLPGREAVDPLLGRPAQPWTAIPASKLRAMRSARTPASASTSARSACR